MITSGPNAALRKKITEEQEANDALDATVLNMPVDKTINIKQRSLLERTLYARYPERMTGMKGDMCRKRHDASGYWCTRLKHTTPIHVAHRCAFWKEK